METPRPVNIPGDQNPIRRAVRRARGLLLLLCTDDNDGAVRGRALPERRRRSTHGRETENIISQEAKYVNLFDD